MTWLFQKCGNPGTAFRSGLFLIQWGLEADMCVFGSNPGETEKKNERRQQATCYHFKYFLSTYPEFNFNKWLQIRLNAAHVI